MKAHLCSKATDLPTVGKTNTESFSMDLTVFDQFLVSWLKNVRWELLTREHANVDWKNFHAYTYIDAQRVKSVG